MAHPYPPRWAAFSYVGRYQYSLTFVTDARRSVFVDRETVDLVLKQILRAAAEERFALIAYCFMPDHVHLIVAGADDNADCKRFIRAAKQYSGYYYSQARQSKLWDRYGHDRVVRDDRELTVTVRYILANPVRAGLVNHPEGVSLLGIAAIHGR